MPANPVKNNTANLEQVGEGHFAITGNLDFQTVPLVWQQSTRLFTPCASIEIDLSGVASSNSAGLALLIEWMRYANTRDKAISFHHLPAQMLDIARVCGVEKNLPLMD